MGLVVLDFDGPIVDSLELTFGLRKIEYPRLTLKGYVEMHESNFFAALGELGWKKVGDIDYGARYAEGILGIAPVFGVAEMIRHIEAHGFEQSIVSGNAGSAIEPYLKKYGLKKYFAHILGSDFAKSKVEKFREVMRRHDVRAENVLYITDTPGDVREAHELGIRCIAVTWGFCPLKMLAGANPAYLVKSPSDVLPAIRELFAK